MNSIRKLLLNLCQISVFWTRMLLKPVRHLGTVLCFHFSGETLTWSLRQKGYFCVWHRLMFRMKAPFYLKKKHALYAYGRRNDFDIDLAWVGLGGGIPLLHFKKNICTIQHKMLSLSFLSKFRLYQKKITLLWCMCFDINYHACRYLLLLKYPQNTTMENTWSLLFI